MGFVLTENVFSKMKVSLKTSQINALKRCSVTHSTHTLQHQNVLNAFNRDVCLTLSAYETAERVAIRDQHILCLKTELSIKFDN
jgi:hypothetical protein